MLLSVLWLSITTIAAADEPHWNPGQPGSELSISLITVGPGEIYWERFGHNAIRVRDAAHDTDTLYNYGIFDFEQESFLLNFLRGRMQYRIAAWPTREDLRQYHAEGREILEQKLNLAPAQRAKLRDFLEWNARAENAEYRYDYFTQNCSTKVRDALDRALDGAIARSLESRSRGYTYRMHALRLTAPDPVVYLGIHVGLGPFTDRKLPLWDDLFVPMEVARHLREVKLGDDAGATIPLVADETLLAASRIGMPEELPPSWRLRFLAAGLGLGAILLGLGRLRASPVARFAFAASSTVIALLLGLGGLLLLGLWGFTEHRSAWANENLFLFDPLWLLLLPALIGSARAAGQARGVSQRIAQAIAVLAFFGLFLKVFPAFYQDNLDWIALWLPVTLAILAGMRASAAR